MIILMIEKATHIAVLMTHQNYVNESISTYAIYTGRIIKASGTFAVVGVALAVIAFSCACLMYNKQ